MSPSAKSGADSVPLLSLSAGRAAPQPLGCSQTGPACPPLWLSGSSLVTRKLFSVPGALRWHLALVCRPGALSPRACGCHSTAPELFALWSALCLKSCKEESNRGATLRRDGFCLPSHLKLLSCVWDTAVTRMVTHSFGGDPVLPALSRGWQRSFLLVVGIILVFNVQTGLLSACKPL